MLLHHRRRAGPLFARIWRGRSRPPAGGMNPRRRRGRRGPDPRRAAFAIGLVDGERRCSRDRSGRARADLVEVSAPRSPRGAHGRPGVALELAVGEGSFLEGPEAPTRSFDWPRTRSPSRPTATSSTDVPTNAISSLVWTLAGTRPTARTSGLSPRLSGRRFSPTAARLASWLPTRAQGVSGADPPTMLVISHCPSIRATS